MVLAIIFTVHTDKFEHIDWAPNADQEYIHFVGSAMASSARYIHF